MRYFAILALPLLLSGCGTGAMSALTVQAAAHQAIDTYCDNIEPTWRERVKGVFVTARDNRAEVECAADMPVPK